MPVRPLFRLVALAAASVEFFFYAVYSSKLDSDIVALFSLKHIMEASVAVRPGLVLNSVVIVGTRG